MGKAGAKMSNTNLRIGSLNTWGKPKRGFKVVFPDNNASVSIENATKSEASKIGGQYTVIMFLQSPTPTLMDFTGVTNPRGP